MINEHCFSVSEKLNLLILPSTKLCQQQVAIKVEITIIFVKQETALETMQWSCTKPKASQTYKKGIVPV